MAISKSCEDEDVSKKCVSTVDVIARVHRMPITVGVARKGRSSSFVSRLVISRDLSNIYDPIPGHGVSETHTYYRVCCLGLPTNKLIRLGENYLCWTLRTKFCYFYRAAIVD